MRGRQEVQEGWVFCVQKSKINVKERTTGLSGETKLEIIYTEQRRERAKLVRLKSIRISI